MTPDIDDIRTNIAERDRIDSGRENSPLRRPPGSFVVDTSGVTIEQQVDIIEAKVREEAARIAGLTVRPGEKNESARRRLYWAVSRDLVYALFKVLFGLKVTGKDNLSFRETFIFASNHISYADPPLLGCALNREIAFMAKIELFRNPLLGWLIRKYHAFPVRRGAADRRSIREINDRLAGGQSVLLFPEGTRSRTGRTGRLKSGLGMVALGTGKTIVPVFIKGANRLRECFLRRTRLEVRIGRPVRIMPGYEPEDRKADYEVISGMIAESMRMLDEG
ncbi:MAG TPA: 1-acyl-sn-glycerol-3-phosphate acyltransferase, partial [Candidatus Krumholzibacterium sp.]|nr:1-acyl-sn-glycerol-3-phosphate acyltransferase [Candidatus Krumholzibacterium sp.]